MLRHRFVRAVNIGHARGQVINVRAFKTDNIGDEAADEEQLFIGGRADPCGIVPAENVEDGSDEIICIFLGHAACGLRFFELGVRFGCEDIAAREGRLCRLSQPHIRNRVEAQE